VEFDLLLLGELLELQTCDGYSRVANSCIVAGAAIRRGVDHRGVIADEKRDLFVSLHLLQCTTIERTVVQSTAPVETS